MSLDQHLNLSFQSGLLFHQLHSRAHYLAVVPHLPVRYPNRGQPISGQHVAPELLHQIVRVSVVILMLSLFHGFFHLRRRHHPTLDALRLSLVPQDESARRCLVRHDDLGFTRLLRSSLHFFK